VGAIARWQRLSAGEQRLVVRVMPAVVASTLRLRTRGVKHTLAWAAVPLAAAGGPARDDLTTAVDRAARYVPGATCLARSAALARLLRKNGVPARVRLGVAAGETFAAHAWVEVDGVPLADAPARFTPLPIR
jgi:hypothetical protein